MPIPSRQKDEDKDKFMSRCMGDEVMQKEYPDMDQRSAICMSKAIEGASNIEAADFMLAQSKKKFKYRNPKTNEFFYFDRRGIYKKDGVTLVPSFEDEDD
jgi:hypothetical protein